MDISPHPRGVAEWANRRWQAFVERVRELRRPESRTRSHALQIAKATVAAIVAWFAAGVLIGSQTAWLAPMTALLMVQSTVYRSVSEGIKRVVAVAVGVAIAAAAGNLIGLNALGLLLVVPLSLLGARLRWIRAQGEYIAITAVILLTFGMSTEEYLLLSYLRDTALGVVAGGLVNLLLFPPGYQRSGRAAVSDLASNTARVLRDVAEGARSGWGADDAKRWQRRAERLDNEAEAAQSALAWVQEGQRWNPWPPRQSRVSVQRYQPAVETLWHVAIEVRGLTRSLTDAAEWDLVDQPLHDDLAPLLAAVADVVDSYGDQPEQHDHSLSRSVTESLERADELYQDLAQRLPALVNERQRFEAGGSILQDLRRILAHLREAGWRRNP